MVSYVCEEGVRFAEFPLSCISFPVQDSLPGFYVEELDYLGNISYSCDGLNNHSASRAGPGPDGPCV